MTRGPVLVYLHGFTSSPASVKARFFAERFRAIGSELHAPDLDEGEGGFRSMTVSRSVDTAARLLDEHGASERGAVVIGSSLGGYAAALLAVRDPRVRSLVLLAPAFDLASGWDDRAEAMARWQRDGEVPIDHSAKRSKEMLGYGFYLDLKALPPFPAARAPTLVLHGVRDSSVSIEGSRRFARSSPLVRLVELDDEHALTADMERLWAETAAFLKL